MVVVRGVERSIQWQDEAFRQGFAEGFKRAWEEGLAAQRLLLVRLTRVRFGEKYAQALAPLLETRTDTEALAEIGEWIVTVPHGEALLARVQQA